MAWGFMKPQSAKPRSVAPMPSPMLGTTSGGAVSEYLDGIDAKGRTSCSSSAQASAAATVIASPYLEDAAKDEHEMPPKYSLPTAIT